MSRCPSAPAIPSALDPENELVRQALHEAAATSAPTGPGVSDDLARGVSVVVGSWREWADRAATYIGQVLDDLDRVAHAPVEDRLELVARSAGEWFGADHWSVLMLDGDEVSRVRGGSLLDELLLEEARSDTERSAVLEELGRAFEGGSFVVVLGDPLGDEGATSHDAEASADRARATVVGAGGYDVDALAWLVCLSTDGAASELWAARAAIAAAVQSALGFPRSSSASRVWRAS